MPRRGENIRRRKDGRWEARYPNGVNEKGTTKYASIYGATYREVKEKRNLVLLQKVIPTPRNCDALLFKDILQLWMNDCAMNLKEATIYRYRYLIETHILPELGGMRIDKVTSTVINAFLAEKIHNGRIDGQGGLSTAYVRSITLVISSALNFAVKNQMCRPLLSQINKPAAKSRELPILSRENQLKLENVSSTSMDGTKLGVLISLYSGLRIGEICALAWEDVDLENQILYVRHTIARVRHEENGVITTKNILDQPKTKASLRCVPICSRLFHALKERSRAAGSKYVVSENADFVSPRTFEYRYRKLLDTSDIPHINFHALRHTFATRCIESGVDVKSLSEILGHANASITLNTYVHSSMELKRTQLEKLVESYM